PLPNCATTSSCWHSARRSRMAARPRSPTTSGSSRPTWGAATMPDRGGAGSNDPGSASRVNGASGARVLDVSHVDLGYGEVQVVFDVSLHVDSGELIGLVGGNGSGKSTILRAVSGMIRPWQGSILLSGHEVGG